MTNVAPFVVGVLVLGRTVFALLSGSAAANNKGFWREDEPMAYWTVIVTGFAASAFLFYEAFRQNGS